MSNVTNLVLFFVAGLLTGATVVIILRHDSGDGGMGKLTLPKSPTPPNRVFVN